MIHHQCQKPAIIAEVSDIKNEHIGLVKKNYGNQFLDSIKLDIVNEEQILGRPNSSENKKMIQKELNLQPASVSHASTSDRYVTKKNYMVIKEAVLTKHYHKKGEGRIIITSWSDENGEVEMTMK